MRREAGTICLVNSLRGYGGAEVWMLDAALGLAGRGHRLLVVAQPGTPLLERARAVGLTTAGVPIRFDAAPWTVGRLAWLFRQHRVRALFCNLTKDLKVAGLAGRLAGVPVVLASRESDFPLKRRLHYRWYFNCVATAIVVNSEATRRTIVRSAPWLRDERIHLLYKGIDTDRFCPAEASPAGRPVVGFAGQLIPRKGLRELMRAWETIEARCWREAPLLRVAGVGVLAADLARWRAGLRRPENVELLGWVEEMPAFLRGLSLLALPSHAEGFGLVAAEAGACALPVVATNASSLPEIVEHECSGLLVPPASAEALAAAMVSLLENRERARRLGLAARARVVRNFSRHACLGRLEALLLGGQPTRT